MMYALGQRTVTHLDAKPNNTLFSRSRFFSGSQNLNHDLDCNPDVPVHCSVIVTSQYS